VRGMAIISVSIPRKILEKVDSSLDEQGFASRSEMIRQALRAFMTEGKTLRELAGEITATVTIIYKRKAKRGQIFDIQHSYGDLISTFLHAHINGDHCLEVIVVKGDSTILRKLVEALRSNEQIIQIKVAVLRQSNLYGPRL
jgi:CopG family nickel-responsive transcriptional regulator